MPDQGKEGIGVLLPFRRIFSEPNDRLARFVKVTPTDGIPGRFGREEYPNEERGGPHPLKDEGKLPAHVAGNVDDGADHTGRQEDTRAPAHADESGDVWAEHDRDDFARIGRGEGLAVSAGPQAMD